MKDVYICDAFRTPIGKYGGALATVRPDDLAALVLEEMKKKHPNIDWLEIDDVFMGCGNQAGEDNRNVARMGLLLAGYSELIIAGGVESMSRAPFVMGKATKGFDRKHQLEDTTIGWRLVNPKLNKQFGTESMIETA